MRAGDAVCPEILTVRRTLGAVKAALGFVWWGALLSPRPVNFLALDRFVHLAVAIEVGNNLKARIRTRHQNN